MHLQNLLKGQAMGPKDVKNLSRGELELRNKISKENEEAKNM